MLRRKVPHATFQDDEEVKESLERRKDYNHKRNKIGRVNETSQTQRYICDEKGAN